jgi:hypothetical protein
MLGNSAARQKPRRRANSQTGLAKVVQLDSFAVLLLDLGVVWVGWVEGDRVGFVA